MNTQEYFPPQTNNYERLIPKVEAFHGPYTLSVSVVIPFYKERAILARTLASLVNQTYPAHLIEVIVSDDGSDEPVSEVLVEFRDRLNLHYIRQENLGHRVATARNRGIERAQGEVIVSLDFDMICPPKFIAAHLNWFHISDRVATAGLRKFVRADHITVDDVISNFERITELPRQQSNSSLAPTADYDHRIRAFANFQHLFIPAHYVYSCNFAYRRRQALAVGCFDERYNYNYGYEDLDFAHSLWLAGIFLVAVDDALAYHQENEVMTLTQKREGSRINRLKFYNKFPEIRAFRRKKRRW